MNRNKLAHFSQAPTVDIERSGFTIDHTHSTTLDAGLLYPIFKMEILPGDTITLESAELCRMATPIFPVFGNCYLDTYFFFVPNRLVFDHWKQFCGENDDSAWDDPVEYFVPHIQAPGTGFESGSLADHFGGIPIKVGRLSVNALPFRAYNLIYNEWFRNQNLVSPVMVSKADTQAYDDSVRYPKPVARFRDYFSSCLPAPQKGDAVALPLSGVLPVVSMKDSFFADLGYVPSKVGGIDTSWLQLSGIGFSDEYIGLMARRSIDQVEDSNIYDLEGDDSWNGSGSSNGAFEPYNLGAIVGAGTSILASINDLRMAFAMQRVLELFARGGSRYVEMIRNFFHVIPDDASLQRPEYLGGHHIPLNISQVIQNSATTIDGSNTPLGQVGAMSKSVNAGKLFTKSFCEHGHVIGVACIRTDRSYQQGLDRMWSRKSFYDFYLPQLAHISEQPVLYKEIYATGNEAEDNAVFGFQEPWVEYRTAQNIVTGGFRHNADSGGLDAWTYADWYSSKPYLSAEWLAEGKENVNRTLAVQSDDATMRDTQFYLDMYFKAVSARPLPLYSIPGLVDHF